VILSAIILSSTKTAYLTAPLIGFQEREATFPTVATTPQSLFVGLVQSKVSVATTSLLFSLSQTSTLKVYESLPKGTRTCSQAPSFEII